MTLVFPEYEEAVQPWNKQQILGFNKIREKLKGHKSFSGWRKIIQYNTQFKTQWLKEEEGSCNPKFAAISAGGFFIAQMVNISFMKCMGNIIALLHI